MNKPAFPTKLGFGGLTKREWFAGVALQGLLAVNQDFEFRDICETAVDLTDYMDKALNSPDEPTPGK